MPRTAQIVSILIASPGDVERQRDVIHGEVESWNRSALSRTLGVQLEALRWELDAIPELGTGDAQSVINRQLRDDADIVVGIFHTRIGTRTARAESGTAEEIENSASDGKPVHVYVDVSDVPINHDPEQLASLKRYVARLSTRGLLREVASDDELARHVRLALDRDVATLLAEGSRAVGSQVPDSDVPAPTVRAREELNRAADDVLRLEAMRGDSPMDGPPAALTEMYQRRHHELLHGIRPLLERVVATIRTGDAARDEAWIELIPVLAPNPHRGGSTRLLDLVRAPGTLLFQLAGVAATSVRNDQLVGRLLSPLISVDDPRHGIRPAVVSLRAEVPFPTEWPSRDLSR